MRSEFYCMLKRQRPPGRRRSAPAPGRRDGGTEGGRAAWWSLVRARGLSPRRTHLYSGRRHVGHEERRDVSHRCWWTDDAVTAAAAGSPAEKLQRPRGPRVDPMAAASRTRVRDPGARARAAGCVPVSGLPERGRDGAKPTEIRVTGSKGSEAAAAHAREGRMEKALSPTDFRRTEVRPSPMILLIEQPRIWPVYSQAGLLAGS
ncbi:uncharacterized protein LOC125752076 isoform X2 [Canis lupus dingo]|uniref:uncharacterized protein LOC125752076 isoform X2 n=1 Tax=Canis lupus dingo TaxID=286419 RepID=UPI000DC6A22D|nr:uncharacterized protein LOC125752076 isoform X2 [Canis lupus dingo]